MRRIAIIGSGISGLLTAHGLLRAGYAVTLFSDRTAEQWLTECRPTGTAARFPLSLEFERSLGLSHWEAETPKGEGVHLTFCPEPGNRLLTLSGRLEQPFLAVDVRLQSHRWMKDLEARGGELVIESVTIPRLEQIAAEHDLTVVAAGRAEIQRLFERDAERSVYDRPQRNLAMVVVKGPRLGFDGVPCLPVKFNLFASTGEMFWVPYLHKDVGPCWNLVFEAKEGTISDRFQGAKSGVEAVEIAKGVIRELVPWDWAWAREMELADPNGWLVGRFPPTVRHPVGRLPSGRLVTPVGDTCMSLDPIGGQGANNGARMARNLVESIVERGDRPFDEAWMRATFERFWERHGKPTYTFNNLLLEPITPAAKEVLIAQYGSDGRGDSARQRLANAFCANFNDPGLYTATFQDLELARSFIQKTTGRSWIWSGLSGRLAIAQGQLRQKLGLEPNHPSVAGACGPAIEGPIDSASRAA